MANSGSRYDSGGVTTIATHKHRLISLLANQTARLGGHNQSQFGNRWLTQDLDFSPAYPQTCYVQALSAMSRRDEACCEKAAENAFLLNWTRDRLRRTTQKLRRTMITTADWPPPRVIFNSEVSTTHDRDEDKTTAWFLPCCFQGCRNRSPEVEDSKGTRLSQMLMGTYKKENSVKCKNLMLRTGPDGSLICPDHVDVSMLIEGFREFERRFQYGTLMPFANVLPSINPARHEVSQKAKDGEINEQISGSSDLKDEGKNKKGKTDRVFQESYQDVLVVQDICEE
ncbi:unnamed protein product [Hydatigera taeniaeformis]|uniref:PAP-associated domain-containing protein n=1 Tax=Hydatigena taeniaeformis TaxID=6205 RepID=A0A0R3X3X6_HYDTA|nr:unnamed protein product [Hydatigera taeniaeformis]